MSNDVTQARVLVKEGDNEPDYDFNESKMRRQLKRLKAKRDKLWELEAKILALGGEFYESDIGNRGVNTFALDQEIAELEQAFDYGPFFEEPKTFFPEGFEAILTAMSSAYLERCFEGYLEPAT